SEFTTPERSTHVFLLVQHWSLTRSIRKDEFHESPFIQRSIHPTIGETCCAIAFVLPVWAKMKVDLSEQVALVTGAARGIGQATADLLAKNGARVVYADLDFETAQVAAAQAKDGTPLAMDVTSEAQVEEGVGHIIKQHGRLDILVNNAGINTMKHRVNIDQFPLDEWHRILSVDLTGLFLVSRAASRVMLERKSGRIINLSSVLGVVPARLQCAYTTAKA